MSEGGREGGREKERVTMYCVYLTNLIPSQSLSVMKTAP